MKRANLNYLGFLRIPFICIYHVHDIYMTFIFIYIRKIVCGYCRFCTYLTTYARVQEPSRPRADWRRRDCVARLKPMTCEGKPGSGAPFFVGDFE